MSDRNKFSKEYMELENKYLGQKLVYDKLRTERDQLLEDKKALEFDLYNLFEMFRYGAFDNWECLHGHTLDECPNNKCTHKLGLDVYNKLDKAHGHKEQA